MNAGSDGSAKASKGDRLAIVISIIALIISGLSWWDSHRAGMLESAEVNRDLIAFQAMIGNAGDTDDPLASNISILYRNVGDVALTVKKTQIYFLPTAASTDVWSTCRADLAKMPSPTNVELVRLEIPVHKFGSASIPFGLPASCSKMSTNFPVRITYTARDSLKDTYTIEGGITLDVFSIATARQKCQPHIHRAMMNLFSWHKFASYARPIIAVWSFHAIGILPSSESRLRSGANCPFRIASIAAGPRRAKGRIRLTYAT
jgi:hypothetical protein